MYQITIDETGRNTPKDDASLFDTITETVSTLEDVKAFLINHYGKLPNGRKKIYQDTKDGTPVEVGFLHSFWNSDISHNSKAWFQTDWITINHVKKTPILYKQIKEVEP